LGRDPHADDLVDLITSVPVLTEEQRARITELASAPL
jgi:hypothetical protein